MFIYTVKSDILTAHFNCFVYIPNGYVLQLVLNGVTSIHVDLIWLSHALTMKPMVTVTPRPRYLRAK